MAGRTAGSEVVIRVVSKVGYIIKRKAEHKVIRLVEL